MAEITIEISGIDGVTGSYVLDTDQPFTNRELHVIKQMSGVRLGEFDEALGAVDNDLLVAFTAVALRRSEKDVPADALWDAPAGAITFEVPKAEADAVPPPVKPLASPQSDSERPPNSGDDSSSTGDSLVSVLRPTGTQD